MGKVMSRLFLLVGVALVALVGYVAWAKYTRPTDDPTAADPDLRSLQLACNDQLQASKRATTASAPTTQPPGTGAGAQPPATAAQPPAPPAPPAGKAPTGGMPPA